MKDRLKQIRKNLGVTQAKFAEMIGLSRNMIAQVETGSAVLSNRSIKAICNQFNVNEEWLRDGVGEPYVAMTRNDHIAAFLNNVMEAESEDSRKTWVEVLSKLSVEDWELLAKMAADFVKIKENR